MSNVGVQVTTGLRTGPTNPGTPAGIFQIAGVTERGPVGQSVKVKSIGEYTAVFGQRTPYSSAMFDTARLFFEEGGSDLLVARAVGQAATKGSLELNDSMSAATVKVEAKYAGAYSSELSVNVTNADDKVTLTVSAGDDVLASFRNVGSVAELVEAAQDNRHVSILDLGSTTEAPANLPVTSTGVLSGGSDDRDSVTTQTVIDALQYGAEAAKGGAVAAPGYPADVIGSALIDYAASNGSIALLAPHAGASVAEAIQTADSLINAGSGAYAGMFYPHVTIPDGSGTRIVSPEGYVAAVRARAFRDTGFWATPAGERATFVWAAGTETEINTEINNQLSAAHVNGITTTAGRTRLYNWRSLSTDTRNFSLLSARDTLNNLVVQVKAALEPYVFRTVDGRGWLFGEIEGAAVGVVAPIAEAGGLFARMNGDEELDPGYLVTVDSTNNSLASLEENTVLVDVAVRLSPVAALIKAEIVKVPLSAAL